MTLPFTQTFKSYCKITDWPNFDYAVSQIIRKLEGNGRNVKGDYLELGSIDEQEGRVC